MNTFQPLASAARGWWETFMAKSNESGFETDKFIHTAQIGGIEAYTLDEGPARGVRVLCVNTGAGLRYRVLVDRGMDIDQAFVHQHSLTFLTYKGVTPPTRGLDGGADWLKSFSGGLLTSCGPFNIGPPGEDAGEVLGMHGPHSNTGAAIESIIQPDPRAGRLQMSIVGRIRYGAIFGPCVELCRTITSTLGRNAIDVVDEFHNAGNQSIPHAWLLHINFGYPLVNEGAELCYDSPRVEPTGSPQSMARFKPGGNAKNVLAPRDSYRGRNSAVASLFPRANDRNGRTTVGIVNRKLSLGVALHYSTQEFGRCINWQQWGPGEYATSLEPANGTGDGRWKDRERGLLDTLAAGARKTYRYTIEAVTDRAGLAALRSLNGRERAAAPQ